MNTISLFLLVAIPTSLLAGPIHRALPLGGQEAKKIINEIYEDKSGFKISSDESGWINAHGGNATYGEITFESLEKILNDLHLTEQDVFFDLGCGVGKTCFQVALTTPAKARGYELSPTRIEHARQAKREYDKKIYLPIGPKLEFIEDNIKNANLNNATVVFMCSTCFSDELMKNLTKKLAKKKSGLRVITLKKLSPHPKFSLTKTYLLPMTWSKETPVYLYTLKK